MATLITETFRRIVATTSDSKFKDLLKADIERLISLPNFKSDFKGVKTEIKPSVKDNVLVIDLNGDGADSVARKVKDLAVKHKAEVKIKNEKPMSGVKEGRAMPNIIGSVLNKLQDELTPEVANSLWKEKAAEITDIINSVRGMTGTSTGQKVVAAVEKIKKLIPETDSLNEKYSMKEEQDIDSKIFKNRMDSGSSKIGGEKKGYNQELKTALEKLKNNLSSEGWKIILKFIKGHSEGGYNRPEKIIKLSKSDKEGINKSDLISYSNKVLYGLIDTGDLIQDPNSRKYFLNKTSKEGEDQMGLAENKKLKFNLKSLILETLEKVKAEAKAKDVEAPEEIEPLEGEEKPKGKKLEKDEIGKFYIVTRPTKADDEIVHETNVLDLVTKIKGGQLDASRILGAFKKRGGANALAKIHLKQISAELDELKNHMEEFRTSKKTLEAAKTKAKSTILKYKPTPESQPEELEEGKKKLKQSAIISKTKLPIKK